MIEYDYLITCAGWEDRFLLGLENSFNNNKFKKIIILNVKELAEKNKPNLEKLRKTVNKERIHEVELSLIDDAKTWRKLEQVFDSLEIKSSDIYLDITTMPRFLIWFVMHFSTYLRNKTEIVYYRPKSYECCDWLTSDAEQPRLVFKHSGLFLPDQPTVLIIQTGFDIERVNQLIYSYEPEKVFLGAQVGSQYDNARNNLNKHKEQLRYQEIEYFEIDAYSPDYGFSAIESIVKEYQGSFNIILASFGPKPTAAAMFKINKSYPKTGLSYVLVNNYNDSYSHGIDTNNKVLITGEYLSVKTPIDSPKSD